MYLLSILSPLEEPAVKSVIDFERLVVGDIVDRLSIQHGTAGFMETAPSVYTIDLSHSTQVARRTAVRKNTVVVC